MRYFPSLVLSCLHMSYLLPIAGLINYKLVVSKRFMNLLNGYHKQGHDEERMYLSIDNREQ